MTTPTKLYTIGVAAAEFGMARDTFRKRTFKLGIEPEIRIPHSPSGKGFTEEQMDALRKALRPEPVAASA